MTQREDGGAPARPPGDGAAPRSVAALVVFGIHAGLFLLPRLPVTLWRLVRALAPGGLGVARDDFLSFGFHDLRSRPWYGKIGRDQGRVGRLGYVWDDGFGLPSSPRFYNNFLTYRLYAVLGTRAYAVLALAALAACAATLPGLGGSWAVGAVCALLLLGSPLVVAAYTHLGKPEMLWWALVGPMAYAAFTGRWAAAGALFSAIAFVNFAVAFHAGITLVVAAAFWFPGMRELAVLLACMAPGLLKTALRLVPFVRMGLLGRLVGEQTDATGAGRETVASRLRSLLSPGYALYGVLWMGAAALVSFPGAGWRGMGLALGVLVVFFLGQRLIYLNDPQSFWVWHVMLLLALGGLAPSWQTAAGLVLLSYAHPRLFMLDPPPPPFAAGGITARLNAFPYLAPLSRGATVERLERFFAAVPDGARVLMETRGWNRDSGGYRTFLLASGEALWPRRVQVLPDENARAYHPAFTTRVLGRFQAPGSHDEVLRAARATGAGWGVAYDPVFVARLQEMGFTAVAELDPAAVPALAELLALPPERLVLLRAPVPAGIMDPPAPFRVEGNSLSWEARGGTAYLVRHAWHPAFNARQGAETLAVEAVEAVEGLDLRYMRVVAPADGPVRLTFGKRVF